MSVDEPLVAEVYIRAAESPRSVATFPPDAVAGLIACHECFGTGWWGFGPTSDECGPCIDCKGTGREWVSLL